MAGAGAGVVHVQRDADMPTIFLSVTYSGR